MEPPPSVSSPCTRRRPASPCRRAGRRARPAALFLLLVGLVLLQLLPLPDSSWRLVSPASLEICRQFGGAPAGAFAHAEPLPRRDAPGAAQAARLRGGLHRRRPPLPHPGAASRCSCRTILSHGRPPGGHRRRAEADLERAGSSGSTRPRSHCAPTSASGAPTSTATTSPATWRWRSRSGWACCSTRRRRTGRSAGASGPTAGRFLASESLAPLTRGISLLVLLMSACLLATLSRGAIVASAVAGLSFRRDHLAPEVAAPEGAASSRWRRQRSARRSCCRPGSGSCSGSRTSRRRTR